MRHPLLPERMLVISPSLAATIGLEDAVMLQALHDLAQPGEQGWLFVACNQLAQQVPFWHEQDIKRICKSLTDKGVIQFSSPPFGQSAHLVFTSQAPQTGKAAPQPALKVAEPGRKNLIPEQWRPNKETLEHIQSLGINHAFAMGQIGNFIYHHAGAGTLAADWHWMFVKWVKNAWEKEKQAVFGRAQGQQERQPMTAQWQPHADVYTILQRDNVDLQFIQDCVAEFVLYWLETGRAETAWNSKFIQHVRRQWAKFSHSLQYDTTPTPIAANWQPNQDVFDILSLANIDPAFAQALVGEFVLYWRDSQQAHSSWNSKFLQYVKHRWAQRLTGNSHAGTGHSQPAYATAAASQQRLTDTSW